MFLWIRLNSELLRYQGVQNFAKNNTENAELASKMLKQQHFLYQRKNLYNQEPSRSSSGENVPEKHLRKLPGFYIILALTVLYFGVVADATGASDQISARSASLWGTHGNIK